MQCPKSGPVRGVKNLGQLLVLYGCAVGALKLNVYLVTYRDSRELECRTAYANAEAAAGCARLRLHVSLTCNYCAGDDSLR